MTLKSLLFRHVMTADDALKIQNSYSLTSCFCLLLFIITFVLCSTLVFAVDLTSDDSATDKDIYDRISTLVDSLKVWSERPVPARSNDEKEWKDTLNLAHLFPGCEVTPEGTDGALRIILPRYMDILTTSLRLFPADSLRFSDPPTWDAPVSVENDRLLVDGIPVQCNETTTRDTLLILHIWSELTQMRTLALPAEFQSYDFTGDDPTVKVTIRGRDNVDIPFSRKNWLYSVNRLAEGWLLYAGVLSVEKVFVGRFGEANIRYYVLITSPEATGHHFIEWRESAVKDHKYWRTVTIEAILTPYIRTDNLKDMFAQPDKPDREPIELKIRE